MKGNKALRAAAKARNMILAIFMLFFTLTICFIEKKNDKKYYLDLKTDKSSNQLLIKLFIGSSLQEMNVALSTLQNNNFLYAENCVECKHVKKYRKELSQSLIDYKSEFTEEVPDFTNYNNANIFSGKILSETFYLKEPKGSTSSVQAQEKSIANQHLEPEYTEDESNINNNSYSSNHKLNNAISANINNIESPENKEFLQLAKLEKLQFYLVDKITTEKSLAATNIALADGLLGLNIDNANKNHKNFIYQLWLQQEINQPEFAIFHTKKIDSSKIFIGNFNENSNKEPEKKEFHKLNYCRSSDSVSGWGCNISFIQVKNRKIYTNARLKLEILSDFTYMSYNLLNTLLDYITEEANLKPKGDCIVNESGRLLCKCSDPNLFPDLNINLGSFSYRYALSEQYDFFYSAEYQCHFKILVNKRLGDSNANKTVNYLDEIILGKSALKNTLMSFNLQSQSLALSQLSDSEADLFVKTYTKSFMEQTSFVVFDDNTWLKLKVLVAIFVIIVLLLGLVSFSNNFRFSDLWRKDDSDNYNNINSEEAEIEANRKSLDYCKLTDENYIHKSEKFIKNEKPEKPFSADFNSPPNTLVTRPSALSDKIPRANKSQSNQNIFDFRKYSPLAYNNKNNYSEDYALSQSIPKIVTDMSKSNKNLPLDKRSIGSSKSGSHSSSKDKNNKTNIFNNKLNESNTSIELKDINK